MGKVRRCRRCKEDLPLSAYGWHEARTCDECAAPHPCCVCGQLCPNRYKSCRSVECLHTMNVHKGNRGGRATARNYRKKVARRLTKRCPDCGVAYPTTTEYFYVSLRDQETEEILRLSPKCKECDKANQRLLYQMNAERRRKALEGSKRRRERIIERRLSDPEFDQAYRELRMHYNETYRARRRGEVEHKPSPVDQERAGYVPALPFAEWLHAAYERDRSPRGWDEFCVDIGVSARNVARMVSGEQKMVQADTVDRALINEGSTNFAELYDEDAVCV